MTARGGGIFTTFGVDLLRTIVTGNQPDQCFGCAGATTTRVVREASTAPSAAATARRAPPTSSGA